MLGYIGRRALLAVFTVWADRDGKGDFVQKFNP